MTPASSSPAPPKARAAASAPRLKVCPTRPTASAARSTVRPARPADVPAIHALIRYYSDRGVLLPRTEQDLYGVIPDFRVISSKQEILACAVLRFYTPKAAELRSLAVAPAHRGEGLGRHIVRALLIEARRHRLEMVFAFTYEVRFFAALGFAPIDRSRAPWKAWRDCAHCPKQDCCDEIAVARWISPRRPRSGAPAFPILTNPNIL
jgi:amino-acid N-acetyltransferase